MTIGIYKIEFSDGSVYIGQSNNCERRRGEHFESMLAYLHPNKKVRAAFVRCGKPTWEVIDECLLEDLNTLEEAHINIYNSFYGELGLNLNRGGGVARPKKTRKAFNPVQEKINSEVAAAQTTTARATNKKLGKQIMAYIAIGFLAIITAYICTM